MADHYSGNDPEGGCGLMLAAVLFAVAVIWVLVGLIVLHLAGLF